MNIQRILFGLLFNIALASSLPKALINVTNPSDLTNPTTPLLITSTVTSYVTLSTLTSMPITSAHESSNPTTMELTTATTRITSAATNVTSAATANLTTLTSTKIISTTIVPPGRKFDGISFIGGMILAIGLSAILYLVVSYLRRNNRLPYSNLR